MGPVIPNGSFRWTGFKLLERDSFRDWDYRDYRDYRKHLHNPRGVLYRIYN